MPKTNCQYRTWVEIDAALLRQNIRALRSTLSPGTHAMAVVKSNAYGHGIAEVAHSLRREPGVAWFGVDSFPEAVLLRAEKIQKPILILGATLLRDLPAVVEIGARQTLYDRETLAGLARAAQKLGKPALVHLKIETGTARQGIYPDEVPAFLDAITHCRPHVILEGVYTHFADIEDAPQEQEPYWETQLARFSQALEHVAAYGYGKVIRHTASSAAAMLFPETHFDVARFGITLYGLWPSKKVRSAVKKRIPKFSLAPVLSWKTRIVQVKRLSRGSPVSYGRTERVKRDSVIAVLPVGYWDGYDRGLSKIGEVLIAGKRAKVLGRVCMNMTMVDVTDIPKAARETETVLLGNQDNDEITADEIAAKLDTINYEVVTHINPLIPRVIV